MAQTQPAGAPDEPMKQIALTEAQVQSYIAAAAEIEPMLDKAPQSDSGQLDAKVLTQLDAAAKKHQFASFDDYQDVAANIGLVMDGVDPQTKKYVGADVMLKKQIAEMQADEKMPAADKKQALAEINDALKSVDPVKIAGNIDLVVKYYDKISPPPSRNKVALHADHSRSRPSAGSRGSARRNRCAGAQKAPSIAAEPMVKPAAPLAATARNAVRRRRSSRRRSPACRPRRHRADQGGNIDGIAISQEVEPSDALERNESSRARRDLVERADEHARMADDLAGKRRVAKAGASRDRRDFVARTPPSSQSTPKSAAAAAEASSLSRSSETTSRNDARRRRRGSPAPARLQRRARQADVLEAEVDDAERQRRLD